MSTNKTFNKVQLDVKFTQAATRANLISEENISISFGKISKYFADLHSQAFTGYTHPTYTAHSSGLYKITVDSKGHVSAATAVAKGDIPALDYLPLSGGTMTGQLKTSFKESVAVGSYQAQATKIPDLCTELRYSSGAMGSVSLSEAYTKDGITIAAAWYNFIWIPHRSGGVNGGASGDNCNYGSLILSGMTGSGAFIIRYASGSIAELKYLYKDTTYSANNGVGLSGTTFYNSGVRAVSTGSANGTISVNTNGNTSDVPVKGLASAAYVTQESLLRARSSVTTDGGSTGWSQIGINQYNNAYPDGVTNKIYSYGAVVSMPAPNARFDLYYTHNSSTAGHITNGLQYRTGWDNDKKAWRMLLDNDNYGSYMTYTSNRAGYASSDTHILQLGYFVTDGLYDNCTILVSSAFWGNQHGSSDIINYQQSNNTNDTAAIHVTMSRIRIGGSVGRTFYYKADNTNNRVYLYVSVTGGNSYGRWNTTVLQSSGLTTYWRPSMSENQANSGLTEIAYTGAVAVVGRNTTAGLTTSGIQYAVGQLTIGSADGNAKEGSNASYKLWSYPTGGTAVSSTNANIQNLRLYWSSSYYRDIFISPNNYDIYHRAVENNNARDWRKILDSGNYTSYALASTTKYAASSSVGGPALSVSTAGGDVILGTSGSSSDDSGDIVWNYGNGKEKARLYLLNTYTAKEGPLYRIFKSDGTGLYSGRLPLADGTSASGTWGISITGNAATATTATNTNVTVTDVPSTSTATSDSWYKSYGLVFAQNPNTTQANTLRKSHNLRFYHGPNGTADTVGIGELIVGNNTASGTAGNMQGRLILYSSSSSYISMVPTATSSSVILTLPAVTGTVPSFTATPASGQVVITNGTGGGIKSSGYTIAKSVPSNAEFTDANVLQSETTASQYRPIVFGATDSTDASALAATITGQTYVSTLLYAQPQNGILYANRMYLKAAGAKGQLNLITSKYNVMLRNDDSNTYFLVTAQNDPTGTWTSARPLTINNSTGVCSINGNAASANALNLTHGNELNFSKLASSGHVWFGYRWNTQGTETSGGTTITTYKFGNANGAGGLAGLEATTSTFKSGNFGDQLIVERTGGANMAGITFKNTSGVLGYIAANTVDGDLYHYGATDPSTMQYTILDSHNYTSYPLPRNIKHIHTAGGTEGTAGWVKIARITVTNLYANHPMTFTIAQRGLMQYRIHLVLVNNGSVAAAAISQFIIARDNSWTDTNNYPRAYIIKPSDGIFDLYIRKTEGYDHIFVVDFTKADSSEGDNYSVTWTNVHAADSAITGGTEAVKKLYLPSTTNYAGSSSVGGAATSANKLNTNAGAGDRPVYFSGGVPVQCAAPESGSWWKGVPLIGTNGVTEIGRIIDFHSTNTSTADYDLRLQYTGSATGKTVTLPGASGYVALLTKGSTSYYGMMDGDGSTSGWIRATSNGFIPSASAKFFQTATSSLGTNSWYFNSSYIQNMTANRLVLGAAKTADGAAKGQVKFFSGNGSDSTGTVTLECIDDAVHTGDYTVKLPTWNGTIPIFEKLFEGASNTVSLSYSDINEYDVFLITVANSNATTEQVTVTSLWISNVAGLHDMPLIWGGAPTSSGGACNVTSGWIQLSKNSGTTTFVVAHKPSVAQMTSSGWTISSPTYNLYIRKIFGLKAYKRT